MRGAIKSGGAGRTVLTTPTRSSARSSRDGGSIGRSRGRGGPFAAQRSTMFVRRLVARPLLASVKDSTGIVGLDVVPNARDVLISLYQQTLHAVQPIPASVQYRKSVEALTQHRLQVPPVRPFLLLSRSGFGFCIVVPVADFSLGFSGPVPPTVPSRSLMAVFFPPLPSLPYSCMLWSRGEWPLMLIVFCCPIFPPFFVCVLGSFRFAKKKRIGRTLRSGSRVGKWKS